MGWWFGRKSAPAEARPYVPAWLNTDSQEEGFARSIEGMTVYVKSAGTWANYRAGSWEIGKLRGTAMLVAGTQVVGAQLAPITAPTGGAVVDAEGRSAISEILAALRQHGLIAS